MSRLSVFVDESGDVGTNSDFYLVTFVFHEQRRPINEQVSKLEEALAYLEIPSNQLIHSAPIVRNEGEWRTLSLETRQKVFNCMLTFLRLAPISYKTFCIRKRKLTGRSQLHGCLTNELGSFFSENLPYFLKFAQVIVYYDNGQSLVTNLINTVFQTYLTRVETRKIFPVDYRLSQAADTICTLELVRHKMEAGIELSKSEKTFFGSRRRLERGYLKTLDALSFD